MMDYVSPYFANWYDRGREYCTIFCNADVYTLKAHTAPAYTIPSLSLLLLLHGAIYTLILRGSRSWCRFYLLGDCFFDRRSIFNTKMQARMLLLLSKQTNTINNIAIPCLMAINIVVDNIIII